MRASKEKAAGVWLLQPAGREATGVEAAGKLRLYTSPLPYKLKRCRTTRHSAGRSRRKKTLPGNTPGGQLRELTGNPGDRVREGLQRVLFFLDVRLANDIHNLESLCPTPAGG